MDYAAKKQEAAQMVWANKIASNHTRYVWAMKKKERLERMR